jgi:acyl-CoA thioesterase-1
MNPIVVLIANGDMFFIGVGTTVAAFILRLYFNNRYVVVMLTAAWLLGISLVVLSAAPLHPLLYLLWFALCIGTRLKLRSSNKSKVIMTSAFAVFSLIICLCELPFHLAGKISISKGQTIYVIGDSISAGLGEKERTWPTVLGDLSQFKVVNLARAGATLDTASFQVGQIPTSNSLVLVEIGGNDLLGKTDSRTFYRQLDDLLEKLKSKNAQVALFELPLLPFWNNYGRDQRILAEKYDANLIPKYVLVKAFAGNGNTIDGLHLSQQGHNELAGTVFKLLIIHPSGGYGCVMSLAGGNDAAAVPQFLSGRGPILNSNVPPCRTVRRLIHVWLNARPLRVAD